MLIDNLSSWYYIEHNNQYISSRLMLFIKRLICAAENIKLTSKIRDGSYGYDLRRQNNLIVLKNDTPLINPLSKMVVGYSIAHRVSYDQLLDFVIGVPHANAPAKNGFCLGWGSTPPNVIIGFNWYERIFYGISNYLVNYYCNGMEPFYRNVLDQSWIGIIEDELNRQTKEKNKC